MKELRPAGLGEHGCHFWYLPEAMRIGDGMKSNPKLVFFPLVLAIASLGATLAQTGSSVTVWKLNVAKSIFPGPAPQSLTRTVTAEGGVTTLSFEGIGADGKRASYSYITRFDEKDYPVTGAAPPSTIDTMAVKRIDAKTTQATGKKDGKAVLIATNVLSSDGKTLVVTTQRTDKDGRSSTSVAVWEKQ